MSTSNKAKLTCCLTGKSRQSSHKYIAKKAETYGVSSEEFTKFYTTKESYLNFKNELATNGVEQTLESLNMDRETAEYILRYNGKSKKTLKDFTTKTVTEAPVEEAELVAV